MTSQSVIIESSENGNHSVGYMLPTHEVPTEVYEFMARHGIRILRVGVHHPLQKTLYLVPTSEGAGRFRTRPGAQSRSDIYQFSAEELVTFNNMVMNALTIKNRTL